MPATQKLKAPWKGAGILRLGFLGTSESARSTRAYYLLLMMILCDARRLAMDVGCAAAAAVREDLTLVREKPRVRRSTDGNEIAAQVRYGTKLRTY